MINRKIIFISLLFFVAWVGLLSRALWLQVLPNERLANLKTQQFQRKISVESRRGDIFDRNGYELAISTKAFSVFADPSMITRPQEVAKQLSKHLKLSKKTIELKLRKKNRFVWLQRSIDDSTFEKIKKLQIKGLGFINESKRYYPQKQILAPVLGFVGQEGRGLEGLEYSYDSVLRGHKKQVLAGRDAKGRTLIKDLSEIVGVEDGRDLKLTLDLELQVVLENELKKSIEKHDAEKAVGVILDAQTSEVLAMASLPSFDANWPNLKPAAVRKNRVITDNFEPGSTIKPLLIAGALETNRFQPNTIIDCEGGRARVGQRWVREADETHSFDKLTVTEILAQSSNIGVAKMAQTLGDQKVNEIFRRFGLGQKYDLGLPGEQSGLLPPLPWRPADLSSRSFGHSLSATALQLAVAYTTIANGGLLRPPRIVHAESDGQGRWMSHQDLRPSKRVLPEALASTMTLMLTQATAVEGTGHRARVPGFLVAGKTGTAQKVDLKSGGYLKGAYISSFAGFAPAHQPAFVVYIAIDHPKKEIYGSQTAAPVFASVIQFALRKAGLSPMLIEQEHLMQQTASMLRHQQNEALNELKKTEKYSSNTKKMPDLLGLSARDALKKLSNLSHPIKMRGEGWLVLSRPQAGEDLKDGQSIQLEFASSPPQVRQSL